MAKKGKTAKSGKSPAGNPAAPPKTANKTANRAANRAAKKPYFHKKFGGRRADPYFYLREKDNPETLAFLKAENQYALRRLKGTEPLQKKLFQEMRARIPGRFDSEPAPEGGYLYFSSWEKGKEYLIHKRRKKRGRAEEISFRRKHACQKP